MAPKKSVTSVGFQLKKITTEQFAIIPEAYDNKNQDINMDLGLSFGIDTKSKVIAVFVKVRFEQQEKPFIILEIANHFQVEEDPGMHFVQTLKIWSSQKDLQHIFLS